MSEERWHNFAKEKPSEDMEGRNFIVSNGHYEKIATWCGYWENEPFMGDHLCDEVVRWKFYFTLEEEKANESTNTELKPMKCDELEEEYLWTNNVKTPSTIMVRAYNADDVDKAIAELKAEIESLKASHYAEMVDAGMRERRLRRAFYKACANWAHIAVAFFSSYVTKNRWRWMELKCLKKVEEYK